MCSGSQVARLWLARLSHLSRATSHCNQDIVAGANQPYGSPLEFCIRVSKHGTQHLPITQDTTEKAPCLASQHWVSLEDLDGEPKHNVLLWCVFDKT